MPPHSLNRKAPPPWTGCAIICPSLPKSAPDLRAAQDALAEARLRITLASQITEFVLLEMQARFEKAVDEALQDGINRLPEPTGVASEHRAANAA